MTKPPVEKINGPKVVQIADFKVSYGRTKRDRSCPHHDISYDKDERRIWCHDCDSEVDAFDAFMMLVGSHSEARAKVDRELAEVRSAKKHAVRYRATKALDAEWGKRNTVPLCPHCHEGLLPGDFVGKSISRASKQIVEAKRDR